MYFDVVLGRVGAERLAGRVLPLISLPVTVTSWMLPASTWVMNSLNFSEVSFFWIWAKCQARKMTTSSDIHSMIVLNVAFTTGLQQALDTRRPRV